MSKGEPIITYLSNFTQVQDELGGVGMTVADNDHVILALLGLHKPWENFQDVVSVKGIFPTWKGYGVTMSKKKSREG